MKFALSALVVAVAGVSSASFDLVLIADAGSGVVHRYDGDSGAYLGNFGGGDLAGCFGITIKQSLGRAYVGLQNGVAIYDYNTGELVGATDLVTSRGLKTTTTGLIAANGGTALYHMNNLTNPTGFLQYSTTAPEQLFSAGVDSTGDYLGFGSATGRLTRWNPAVTASHESTALDTGMIGHAGFAISGTTLLTVAPNGTVHRKNTQSLGSAPQAGFNLSAPWSSAIDLEFAHPGWVYGLGKIGTSVRLQKYRQSGGGVGPYFDPFGASRTLTQVTNPVGIAIVAAPEPGSLAALAVASLILLRRRR